MEHRLRANGTQAAALHTIETEDTVDVLSMYTEACAKADAARARWEAAPASKAGREAAEDLAFWQGRKAHLAAQL